MSVVTGRKSRKEVLKGERRTHPDRGGLVKPVDRAAVRALAVAVCRAKGYALAQVRFYTRVPDARDDARWNRFWTPK